jgi:uncharacterized protein
MMDKQFTELSRGECLRLLRSEVLGRVVFTVAALPTVQPVNYLLDGEEILFRTAVGGRLAAATRNAVVAFEVDDIDTDTRTGWSVVGVGRAYPVVDPARLVDLAGRLPQPWAPVASSHTVGIPIQVLTGRRLMRADERSGPLLEPCVRAEFDGVPPG